jgi:hypothetical protein
MSTTNRLHVATYFVALVFACASAVALAQALVFAL